MKVDLIADRVYRRTESIRWRGKKIGTVVDFKDPLNSAATVTVEVSNRTLDDMMKSNARLILERGNVVEVYKK